MVAWLHLVSKKKNYTKLNLDFYEGGNVISTAS